MRSLTILASAVPQIILGRQNLKWVTWPCPFQWIVRHPWDSTCYDQPIYQISSLYLWPVRRYERRYKIAKWGCFGVVRGHCKVTGLVQLAAVWCAGEPTQECAEYCRSSADQRTQRRWSAALGAASVTLAAGRSRDQRCARPSAAVQRSASANGRYPVLPVAMTAVYSVLAWTKKLQCERNERCYELYILGL